MNTRRGRLPYVDKDYDSIREELIARIPQLTERWTDFNASDLGVVLLELFAGIADMLAYYVDAQAAECYLPTARQRQNIANLCALVGYRLHGPIAASSRVVFTLGEPMDEDILIPSGTVISAADEIQPIYFTTVRDLNISAGNTIGEVDAIQGVPVTESFIGTGTSCEKVKLNRTDVANGSVTVKVTNIDWMQIDHFVESGSESMHYRVDIDGLDNVSIIFGDGKYGAYPSEGQQIEVSYLATLGANGNLAPHRINSLISAIYGTNGESVGLSVDNSIAATGGADRETQEHAKAVAPTTVRSTWKAVTRNDYAALCLAFPGVAKAKTNMFDVNRVMELALEMGFVDTAFWVCENRRLYATGIIQGFKSDKGGDE